MKRTFIKQPSSCIQCNTVIEEQKRVISTEFSLFVWDSTSNLDDADEETIKTIIKQAVGSQIVGQIRSALKSKYGEDILVGVSDPEYIDVEIK